MEQLLDVSDLSPPEPLELILDALANMASTDLLRVRHRRDPVPLYRLLRQMGYDWETTRLGPTQFEILIWQRGEGSRRSASDARLRRTDDTH